jgi:hypothetical protein
MIVQKSDKWWQVPGPERLTAEAARVEAMLRDAAPPPECGPEIVTAPARGPFRVFEPRATAPGGRMVHDGYRGPGEGRPRKAVARVDVFEVMVNQARRRSKDAPLPFTSSQMAAGRAYAALVERTQSAGVKGVSLEVASARTAGGGNGCFIEAVMADRARLTRMEAAIGDGSALAPADARRHMDRSVRQAIPVRKLVDGVCLEGKDLSAILKDANWQPKGATRAVLRAALCAALDRMYETRAF